MAKIWRIKNGVREQIDVDLYDYWKDGNHWKVKTFSGVTTFKTKKAAYEFAVTSMSVGF